jgi:hypothetical protein
MTSIQVLFDEFSLPSGIAFLSASPKARYLLQINLIKNLDDEIANLKLKV